MGVNWGRKLMKKKEQKSPETVDAIVGIIERVAEELRQSLRQYKAEQASGEAKALLHLTLTQLHYIHAIYARNGVTASELSNIFHVQKPTVTNIINRLQNQGLVEKEQSSRDRRIFHLTLTEAGKNLVYVERRGYRAFAERAEKLLTAEEYNQLYKLLEKLLQ